jgi:hypothetical protein
MSVDWRSLGAAAVVSLGVAVAIVVIFSVGILAWSVRGDSGGTGGGGGEFRPSAAAAAALCFLSCVLIIGYGIYLIVPS